MPRSTGVGRIAAILALIGAAAVVLLVVLGGGGSYTVTLRFENASQLVPGNNVSVAGVPAGSVKEISLADDGEALVKIEVSDEYAPLPQGTHASVRSQSLSGIANRYVSLDLPATDQGAGETIAAGGEIDQSDTTSEVDLDQLFNTLNAPTVRHLKAVIKGFARSYDGVGPQANKGFYYLNPFLSTSRRVFGELNSNQPALERLIVDSASLTSALAERSPDIEALVGNADRMFGAIGRRNLALASAIGQLPDFMRQFNTTAVNLRATLDDVDPLVTASRPVARKLQPFARRLRGFARDAVPTVSGLDNIVKRKGHANDLIELTRLQVPLGRIGVGPVERNGQTRQGALPSSTQALNDSLPELQFFRPYTSELVGWFDDFGHSGVTDANGGIGRIGTTANVFSASGPPAGLAPCNDVAAILLGTCPPATPNQVLGALSVDNLHRCPGSNERDPGDGSTPFTDNSQLDCDPSEVPLGP